MLAAVAVGAPVAAFAGQAPDLSKYDCTRTDGGSPAAGDELIAQGFRIVSVGRFGQPNVMLADSRSPARANCLIRPEAQK